MSNDREIENAAREALRVLRKVAGGTAQDVTDLSWAITRQERGVDPGNEVGPGGKEVYGALDHLDSRLKRQADGKT